MLNLKTKTENLIVSMLLLIIIIASVYAIKLNTTKNSIETATLQNTTLQETSAIKNINAVVIRKNE